MKLLCCAASNLCAIATWFSLWFTSEDRRSFKLMMRLDILKEYTYTYIYEGDGMYIMYIYYIIYMYIMYTPSPISKELVSWIKLYYDILCTFIF